MASVAGISIEKQGRRHYLIGNTYRIKDRLRSAGCKWDSDRKAWWTGKADVAAQLATAGEETAPESKPASERPAPGDDSVVAARATYKGRRYYIAGKTVRGRTHWDDSVECVSTRDGAKWLLYFRDGSKSFWAPRQEVQIIKTYDRPQTLGGLKRFAEEAKASGGADNYLADRAERSNRCRECRGPIVDAPHHGAMGGYCGRCAFDEFDQ